MPPDPIPPIVTTSWLAERIGQPGVAVLDASWYLPTTQRDARLEYLAGHLPGARYFDLDRASEPGSALPHMLPEPPAFEAVVRTLGISDDTTVVVYDGSGTNLSAARAWWMLRVFGHQSVTLLDGGAPRWRSEGRLLEAGMPPAGAGTFHAQFSTGTVRDLAQVGEGLRRGTVQVVDMRSAGRFAGIEPEPRPGIPSGHMPGALNLPYADLVGPDGLALPPDQLRGRLTESGIRLDRPIIATCGSGVTACTLLHALERLGHHDHALYDGSWTEWTTAGMPVACGGSRLEEVR